MIWSESGRRRLHATRLSRKLIVPEQLSWFEAAQEIVAEYGGDQFRPRNYGSLTIATVDQSKLCEAADQSQKTDGWLRREVSQALPATHKLETSARVRWLTHIHTRNKTHYAVALDSEVIDNEIQTVNNKLQAIGHKCIVGYAGVHLSLGSFDREITIPQDVISRVRGVVPDEVTFTPVKVTDRSQVAFD